MSQSVEKAARDLNAALVAADVRSATGALNALVSTSRRWKRVLMRIDVVDDPASPSFDAAATGKRLNCLLAAATVLRDAKGIEEDEFQWIASLTFFSDQVGRRLNRVRSELEGMAFIKDSLATQTFRLGVLIEHQNALALKAALATSPGQTSDPHAHVRSNLPLPGGGYTSLLGAVEQVIESAELILRYSHYRSRKGACPVKPLETRSPFDDPEVARVLSHASAWKLLGEAHAEVRFEDWRVGRVNAQEGSGPEFILGPHDEVEAKRRFTGGVREQVLLAQFLGDEMLLEYSDTIQAVRALADSLNLPKSPQGAWDGRFDTKVLAAAAQKMHFSTIANDWIALRHYEPLVTAIRLPTRGLECTDWLHARAVISLLARAFEVRIGAVADPANTDWARRVVIIRKGELVDFVRADGVLKKTQAEAAVDLLTFSAGRRSLEIWDQPLLPLFDDRLLLVPSLVTGGSAARALENASQQWPPKDGGVRGIPFERRLADEIGALCPGEVQHKIEFQAQDGRVEFDIVWWWGGYLFLIETKCVRSVHAAAEFLHAKEEVEGAFEQLRRREGIVRSEWIKFRNAASNLRLPDDAPPQDRIISLALTNVLSFTPWRQGGQIATDDTCFRRYFGSPDISVYRQSPTGDREHVTVLGHIRRGSPSPSGFLAYLADPPQVSMVAGDVATSYTALPGNEGDARIAWTIFEYRGAPLSV